MYFSRSFDGIPMLLKGAQEIYLLEKDLEIFDYDLFAALILVTEDVNEKLN